MASVYYPRTFQGFMNWKPETRYKYEWNKGKIEKTEHFKQAEAYIVKNLNRLFFKTKTYQNGGELMSVVSIMTSSDQLRKPDFSYFTSRQIIGMTKNINQVPTFVIEIISPSDNQNKILEKNQEYFAAGVQLIWLIMPNFKRAAFRQVHIYSSPKKVQICTDDDICSAKPVLPDFEISVNNLLRLPS